MFIRLNGNVSVLQYRMAILAHKLVGPRDKLLIAFLFISLVLYGLARKERGKLMENMN